MTGFDLQGPDSAPLLVLSPSLGTPVALWEPQMPALTSWFRVLRVDHPGHGDAGVARGPYSVEALGRRIIEIVDGIGDRRFSFVGLSLGGMVGMWLAANHPERIDRLALCCAAPAFGPPEMWIERARNVRRDGTRPTRETLLARWFTARFVAEHPSVVDRFMDDFLAVDAEAYALCCEVLANTDLTGDLAKIEAPTLVLAGARDPVVPPPSAAATMDAIDGASLVVLADAPHLANVEQPRAFTDALLGHLTDGVVERGRATRQAVLGDIPVNAAAPEMPGFNRAFDDLITKMYWGEVWARPGLDLHTRRLLNIGMLIAINHLDGVAVHVRAALRDGVSVETLQEVLLQAAVCAGVPAANSARFTINRVIAEEEKRSS